MFKQRAKARSSIRARVADDDEPSAGSPLAKSSVTAGDADTSMDVDEDEGAGNVLSRVRAKKKGKKLGQSTRLSFGGEDNESESSTPFKQKKSLLSQALKASNTPSASSPAAAAPVSSSPSYSREYLSELKAATPTRAPQMAEEGDSDGDDSGSGLSRAAREKYATVIDADTTAGIPDPAAIAAAKSRRKAAVDARRHGVEPGEDYISLGKEPHPDSRLMREEDEGEDGDEDLAEYTGANDTFYLGKKANKAASRRLKGEMDELIAEREMESESDEETREWERTMAERGGIRAAEPKREDKKPDAYVPTPIPIARPVPTLAAAEARIAQRLAEVEALQAEQQQAAENATRELVDLEEQERDVRRQVEEVEAKRAWVEDFQRWVEMLGTFLEEKVPRLEEIEKQSSKYIQERAELVSKQRTGDDSDDLALFLGVAQTQTKESEQTTDESAPTSEVRKTRRLARTDRRARRRGIVVAPADDEGMSTDSDLDEDVADDFAAAQHDVSRSVHSLLEDVKAEDFRDPEKGVAVRFDAWRRKYPEEYEGAFGGLSLVQAWEFWARSEMVGWDPARSDFTLDSFNWYRALYNYSRPRTEQDTDDDDDMDLEPEVGPEGDLSVEMVSKTVVPQLIKALENGLYDAYSAPQTRKLVDLVDFVAELLGRDNAKYKSLVKAVMGVFQAHVLELASSVSAAAGPIAMRPPPYNPAARSAMQRYVRRRIKLIRNLRQWRRAAPAEVPDLVARIVSVVLRPVLSKTWAEGGGDDMGKKVLEAAEGSLPPNLVAFLQDGPAAQVRR